MVADRGASSGVTSCSDAHSQAQLELANPGFDPTTIVILAPVTLSSTLDALGAAFTHDAPGHQLRPGLRRRRRAPAHPPPRATTRRWSPRTQARRSRPISPLRSGSTRAAPSSRSSRRPRRSTGPSQLFGNDGARTGGQARQPRPRARTDCVRQGRSRSAPGLCMEHTPVRWPRPGRSLDRGPRLGPSVRPAAHRREPGDAGPAEHDPGGPHPQLRRRRRGTARSPRYRSRNACRGSSPTRPSSWTRARRRRVRGSGSPPRRRRPGSWRRTGSSHVPRAAT